MRLDAYPSLAELVDVRKFTQVSGSSVGTSFLSYVVAHTDANSPQEAAIGVLRAWCDFALHIHGCEPELEKLRRS